jgi:hypothetical protein
MGLYDGWFVFLHECSARVMAFAFFPEDGREIQIRKKTNELVKSTNLMTFLFAKKTTL